MKVNKIKKILTAVRKIILKITLPLIVIVGIVCYAISFTGESIKFANQEDKTIIKKTKTNNYSSLVKPVLYDAPLSIGKNLTQQSYKQYTDFDKDGFPESNIYISPEKVSVKPVNVDNYNKIDFTKSLLSNNPLVNKFSKAIAWFDESVDQAPKYKDGFHSVGIDSLDYGVQEDYEYDYRDVNKHFFQIHDYRYFGYEFNKNNINNTLLGTMPNGIGGYNKNYTYFGMDSYGIIGPVRPPRVNYGFELERATQIDISSILVSFKVDLLNYNQSYGIELKFSFFNEYSKVWNNYYFQIDKTTFDLRQWQYYMFNGIKGAKGIKKIKVEINLTGAERKKEFAYKLSLSKFNLFSGNNIYQPYIPSLENVADYENCEWYNVFCHLRNGARWLIFKSFIPDILHVGDFIKITTKIMSLGVRMVSLGYGWLGTAVLDFINNLIAFIIALKFVRRIFG